MMGEKKKKEKKKEKMGGEKTLLMGVELRKRGGKKIDWAQVLSP